MIDITISVDLLPQHNYLNRILPNEPKRARRLEKMRFITGQVTTQFHIETA